MKKTIITLLAIAMLMAFSANSASAKGPKRTKVEMLTSMGKIVIELYNETPLHRDNFIKLASTGFYNDLLFHRVIEDFMIQGGDPDSKDAPAGKLLGEGGPDYDIPAEINYPALYHKRGVLAAAREGDRTNPQRMSSGSQFYIVWGKEFTRQEIDDMAEAIQRGSRGQIIMSEEMKSAYMKHGGTPHLDGAYTVFGEVKKGFEVINAIQKVATDKNDRPIEDVKILSVTVK